MIAIVLNFLINFEEFTIFCEQFIKCSQNVKKLIKNLINNIIFIFRVVMDVDSCRRMERAKAGIFIVEIIPYNYHKKEFVVLGHSGNVYHVIITNKPTCTCPDYQKREMNCKHIYFILLRVMKLKESLLHETHFSNKRLGILCQNIPSIMDSLYISNQMKNTYNNTKSKMNNTTVIALAQDDDMCPICLDELDNGEELEHCKYSCGKSIHKICFKMWFQKNSSRCLFCGSDFNQTYINLLGT